MNDFIVCLGYKGYIIKEYFANYFLHMSDVTFDFFAIGDCRVTAAAEGEAFMLTSSAVISLCRLKPICD